MKRSRGRGIGRISPSSSVARTVQVAWIEGGESGNSREAHPEFRFAHPGYACYDEVPERLKFFVFYCRTVETSK